ncbi:MAG: phytoene desaturase [Crocinitomicaceae bacterium]|nr:phytoene desaturase [Crocinitomicaceae bacterium]
MKKKATILGAGISGLSAASFLAQSGWDVTIVEKNPTIGGRARQFSHEGFVFDMGPSWYWMPDVFEQFYQKFGYTSSDFYELKRLDPSYRVYWPDQTHSDIPATMGELEAMFESFEPGSALKLRDFLKDAKYKYEVGMKDLVYKPSMKVTEFMDLRLLKGLFSMDLTNSFSTYINRYFSHPKLRSLLEFPVLFLGAMPKDTPALYSLMNYADMELGTWYPMGGMYKFIEAFEKIAKEQGVKIVTDAQITSLEKENGSVRAAIDIHGNRYESDVFISSADYQHTEKALLNGSSNYSDAYWDKRVMAPSALLYYVGINKRVSNILHHNLFFDESLEEHGKEIYKNPQWPTAPLFYLSAPSLTDPSAAPEGCENLFFLIPIAPDLSDDEETRERYFNILLERLKNLTGNDIKDNIVYKRSFSISNFKEDYHAFKGNAYGLANTLKQTAIFKPQIKNKNLRNFFYTGQLTVPGPGVPPSIISGEVVAKYVHQNSK